VRVGACVAEGLGSRGPARVVEGDPHTVWPWLGESAEQLRALSREVLHAMRVQQGPLAALCALLRAGKDTASRETAARARLAHAPHGVWGAMAPESQRRRAIDGGKRPGARAPRFVHPVARVCAPDGAPLVRPAGCRESLTAWVPPAGDWGPPPRRQGTGPLPQRLSAPVVQPIRPRRLSRVRHCVGVGTLEAVKAVLAPHGWHSHPACVERSTLRLRQHGAAVGRRVRPLGKGEDGGRPQPARSPAY
jgi:hypothetical protein